MCRMIAIISKNEISKDILNYYVFNSERSIMKQSDFSKERFQKDGWGIGIYTAKKPVVFKSPNPVFNEKEILSDKIKDINTKIFFLHIRNASNPRNLEKNKLIGIENSQPFSYSNYIFSHNGTLSIVDDIYENLGRYSKYVKGVNDSEVLFWNFIKNMDAYGDEMTALRMMRDEIKTVWISVKKKYSFKKPYNGLNVFVSDSRSLFALCDFKMDDEKYSIMTSGWEYGRFAYRKEKDYFIISSEPCDNGKWNKASHSSILSIDLKLNLKFKNLEV